MKGKENSTIVFGKQEITEKKLITQFLLQNQVSFAPTQNVYKDYEAVIKFNKESLPNQSKPNPRNKKQEIPDDHDINLLYQKAGLAQKGKKPENTQSKSNNLPDATKEIAKLILDISKSKKRSAQRTNSQTGLTLAVAENKSKPSLFDVPNKENRIGTEKVKVSELIKQQPQQNGTPGQFEIENILNTTKTSDIEEDITDQLGLLGDKKKFYENGLDQQSCEERLRALYMPDFNETKLSQGKDHKMSNKSIESKSSKNHNSREALSNISSKASIQAEEKVVEYEFSGENFQTFSLGRDKNQKDPELDEEKFNSSLDGMGCQEEDSFLQSENDLVEKIQETTVFGGVQTERGNFTFRHANTNNQARPLPVPPQEEPVNPPTLQFTGYSMSSVEDLPPKLIDTDMSPKSVTTNKKDKKKDRSPKANNKSFASVSSIGDSKEMKSFEDSRVFKDLVEKEIFFAELLSKGSQDSRIMDTSLTIVESEVKFKSSRLKKLYESKYSTKEKIPDESDNGSRRPSANQLDKLKSTCHNSQVSSMILCQNDQGAAESDYYGSAHFDSFEGQKYLCSNESVTSLNNQQQVNEQFNVFMKSQISMINDGYHHEDRFKKNNQCQITSSSKVSLADDIKDF